jgi:hypothetical protein
MFTEILKVQPKLDSSAMSSMESALNGRFARVAKKFGGGIVSALKGGGIAAIAIGLIDKVLNPLQHVQEIIDKSLNRGNEISVLAKQFNTTAGNMARLEAFGKAGGLESESLRMLMIKFQGAVAQSALHPNDPSAVSNYVGKKDTAEAFFEFVQAMQKLSPTVRNLVQQEVFGERQIGRAAEFLNADFKKIAPVLAGAGSAEELTQSAEYLSKGQDTVQLQDARRELMELRDRAVKITPHAIRAMGQRADVLSQGDTKNLSSFERMERLQIAADRIMKQMETGFTKIAPLIAPALEAIPGILDKLNGAATAVEKSRALRGLVPGQGKDK